MWSQFHIYSPLRFRCRSCGCRFILTGNTSPGNPGDNGKHEKCSRSLNHYGPLVPPYFTCRQRKPENGSESKRLTNTSDDNEYTAVSDSLHAPIQKRNTRFVLSCKCFKSAHDNTVGDYKSYIGPDDAVNVRVQHLNKNFDYHDKNCNNHDLSNYSDTRWYEIADKRKDPV